MPQALPPLMNLNKRESMMQLSGNDKSVNNMTLNVEPCD